MELTRDDSGSGRSSEQGKIEREGTRCLTKTSELRQNGVR